jgi:hypothetical protein
MDPAFGKGRMPVWVRLLSGQDKLCGVWCYDACDNLDILWVKGT